MSGDVQVRKRKDKKKKRDSVDRKSEGELFARKPSVEEDEDPKEHHGVHLTKMGSDDVHLHVQGDHETGGNWCAKVFFFSLLAILLGLIGLIIMENRGLSDLDTPLSESRFSNYFEGWVDEHRGAHDEHDVDKVVADHEGAFDEEDEHSEMEDEHELESDPNEEDEEREDDNADLENDGDEDDEGDNEEDEEAELDKDNEEDEDEDEGLEETNEQYGEDEEEDEETNDDDQEVGDKPNDDEDADEGFGDNDASNEVDNQPKHDVFNQRAHDPFDEQTNKTFGVQNKTTNINEQSDKVQLKNSSKPAVVPQDDDFEDDDEPSVEIVENDAGEQLHLQQKKEQEAPQNEDGTNADGSSSSIAVKIIVGVALAFVARLVLIRQNRTDNTSSVNVEEKPSTPKDQPEMIPTEDDIPFDEDEEIVEEYEEEEEEEGGYFSKEEREKVRTFQPATFEELNAMYRPQALDNLSSERLTKRVVSQPYTHSNVVYHSDEQEKPNLSNVSKIEARAFHPTFDSTTKFAGLRSFEPQVQRAQQQSSSSPPAETKTSVTRIIPVEQEHSKPIFGAYSREEPVERSKETQRDPQASVEIDDNQPHSKELIDEEEYDEEIIEEEEEEEDDDAEISDVDDDDLMKRLEAKYGKLPETKYDSEEENVGSDEEDVEDPSWTKINSRGPQASNDGDSFLEEELRRANDEMLRNNFKAALSIYDSILLKNSLLPGALYGAAKALDGLAEKYKSNQMLTEAIQSFEKLINLGTVVDDKIFVEAAERSIERMRFLGMHMRAVKIHKTLMKRFPTKPHFPNQLAVTYLLLNRLADAKHVLEDILKKWPNDGYAKVHYGFILKNLDKNLEKAVVFLSEGIETGENGTQDGRFYFNLGDALQRLGMREEAMKIYKKGAEMKLFPSKYQRSLYNVDHLKAQPYWTKNDTTYRKYFDILEKNFEKIKEEGLNALNTKGYFVDEAESLRDVGDWKQFELFARGYRNAKNCQKAPFTCKVIESFPAARNCKRGQVKFSVMHSGTHVWPHCGPTNCRLRAHLGLKVPPNTIIRVAEEKRSWEEGKFLIFDDSFEHEVWHNGTSLRLVLIIDVWHPELSQQEREELSPI